MSFGYNYYPQYSQQIQFTPYPQQYHVYYRPNECNNCKNSLKKKVESKIWLIIQDDENKCIVLDKTTKTYEECDSYNIGYYKSTKIICLKKDDEPYMCIDDMGTKNINKEHVYHISKIMLGWENETSEYLKLGLASEYFRSLCVTFILCCKKSNIKKYIPRPIMMIIVEYLY